MLESLESETPNIKDLSVEESAEEKPKIRFNPEDKIIDEMVEEIINRINGHISSYNANSYTETLGWSQLFEDANNDLIDLSVLKLLFPKKIVDLHLDEMTFKFLETSLTSKTRDVAFLKKINYMRMLFPEQISQKRVYQETKSDIIKASENPNLTNNIQKFNVAYWANMLNVTLTDDLISEEEWKSYLSFLDGLRKDKNWIKLTPLLAEIKVLDRKKFDQFQLSNQEWKYLSHDFKPDDFDSAINSNHTHPLIENALDLAIIAADEIVIDDQGVRIINNPIDTFSAQTPPLPEQRSF